MRVQSTAASHVFAAYTDCGESSCHYQAVRSTPVTCRVGLPSHESQAAEIFPTGPFSSRALPESGLCIGGASSTEGLMLNFAISMHDMGVVKFLLQGDGLHTGAVSGVENVHDMEGVGKQVPDLR